MGRIINLILLQFETLFALKKYMALILGLSIFIIYVLPDMFPFIGVLLIMASCYNSPFYEEKSKADYLIYSLPVKSSEYILSKYIFVGINTLISIGIISVLYLVMCITNKGDLPPLWSVILTIVVIGIFMMTILMPIEILIGFEKGRIALVFLTVFPMVFSRQLTEVFLNINIDNIIYKLLITLCVIILILSSYFITSNLYARKDI